MIEKVGDDRFGHLLTQTAADCGIEALEMYTSPYHISNALKNQVWLNTS